MEPNPTMIAEAAGPASRNWPRHGSARYNKTLACLSGPVAQLVEHRTFNGNSSMTVQTPAQIVKDLRAFSAPKRTQVQGVRGQTWGQTARRFRRTLIG